MNILKYLYEKKMRTLNPISFWRAKGTEIGDKCSIHPSAALGSEPYLIKIGNHVRINTDVSLVTHDGGMWVLREIYDDMTDADLFGTIEIGDNVHIGSNAMIMPNVRIGNNCIVGSCAVVTKSVPDNSVVAGIPAKIIESIDEYKKKHESDVCLTKKLSVEEKREFLLTKYKR